MEENETKRYVRRTVDERLQELEEKISFHRSAIATLERKKKVLLTPPKKPQVKKPSMTAVIAEMKKAGLPPEEILKKFALKIT